MESSTSENLTINEELRFEIESLLTTPTAYRYTVGYSVLTTIAHIPINIGINATTAVYSL